MKTPLTSVNIRTYNSGKTLRETLESVRNQTYKNIEIVVSDGHSHDDSVKIAKKYNEDEQINLGTGVETSIKEVTGFIMEIVGFKGSIEWNSNQPDGQPRRQLDISKARGFGFRAKTNLEEGLIKAIKWYESIKK